MKTVKMKRVVSTKISTKPSGNVKRVVKNTVSTKPKYKKA